MTMDRLCVTTKAVTGAKGRVNTIRRAEHGLTAVAALGMKGVKDVDT